MPVSFAFDKLPSFRRNLCKTERTNSFDDILRLKLKVFFGRNYTFVGYIYVRTCRFCTGEYLNR